MENRICVDSPIGPLTIAESDGEIVALSFGEGQPAGVCTEILHEAERQLHQYFAGERQAFDLPVRPAGTPFQRSVWQALAEIPFGETRTYAEIARRIGRPKACRAVGMANHVNPIPVIIPCHRVIGADGSMTGYAGGLDVKRRLLALEGAQVKQKRTAPPEGNAAR